jgi:RNA polymerase sigma factor (sigma-70 family)
MNRRFLQTVLQSLGDIGPPDDELLRQFVAGGSDAAFAELVRRHARLVWTVCRHLTRGEADADDAFQATFLVLLQNARKIRNAAKLSAWLYGVAFKVCGKARQARQRRVAREHARASIEGNGAAVPDSAWDRALAAVHEEAARLPDKLRLPFVLCCLEGKGVTEAALQLRWKVGTLSARLARAKDAVLARIDARGLTLGAVAGVGLALPPAAVLAKAAALAHVGCVIPASILQLTQGAIGMSMKSVKLLAATVMVTCGLGLGVGAGWVTTAQGQAPKREPAQDPQAELKRLQAELDALRQQAEKADRQARDAEQAARAQQDLLGDLAAAWGAVQKKGETYVAKTAKWEYDFVVVSDLGPKKFVEFLQDRENRGWEYNGQTTLQHDGKPTGVWTFRRPAQRGSTPATGARDGQRFDDQWRSFAWPQATFDNAPAIEAEIGRLQARLQSLTKTGKTEFTRDSLPLEPGEFAEVLRKMVQKRFPGKSVKITSMTSGVVLEGDVEVRRWVSGLFKPSDEKEPAASRK